MRIIMPKRKSMVACSLFIIFFISIVLDYFDGKGTKKE